MEKELRRQASSIKVLLCTGSQSPPSPSDRALNQRVKGCRLAMHSAILAKENKELHGENEKRKQKHTQSRRQISSEGLSVLEASALITQQQEANEASPSGPGMHGESALQPRKRPP